MRDSFYARVPARVLPALAYSAGACGVDRHAALAGERQERACRGNNDCHSLGRHARGSATGADYDDGRSVNAQSASRFEAMTPLLYGGIKSLLRCDEAEVVEGIARYVISQHRALRVVS